MSRPRRALFFDGSAGASGDMILGALVDLGVPLRRLRDALARLPVRGFGIASRRVLVRGLTARRVIVRVDDGVPERTFAQVARIVRGGKLPRSVEERALAIFRRLFEAEGEVHGVPADRVHLHEAGALDAIVDVVGACVALHELAPERIVVSPLTTGSGSVDCAHGRYPVPTPATLLLLRGVPAGGDGARGERLTPTGAAILTTVADAWGDLPTMSIERVGHGAGARDFEDRPNVLRAVLGRDLASGAAERKLVAVLECQIDDATPQELAHAAEQILAAGALDAFVTPTVMKKGRPGHLLTVVARPADRERLTDLVLRETPTLGVRSRLDERDELDREVVAVATKYGRVRVKVATANGRALRGSPEHDDCAAAARRHGVALREVRETTLAAWRRGRRRT